MSNPWRPDESASEIFLERTFLAGDFISGLGYGASAFTPFLSVYLQSHSHLPTITGVQVVLYASCAIFLWKTRQSRGRQSLLLLVYTTILLSIETIFSAVQARTVQVIYIDNRDYPGGPWAYFLATQNLPINIMFYATLFILTFLSDLLIVSGLHAQFDRVKHLYIKLWRCWIIWGGSGTRISYVVVSFPLVLVLASFGKNSCLTTFYIYVCLSLTYKYSYGNSVDSAV